jgi:hypothetical protein
MMYHIRSITMGMNEVLDGALWYSTGKENISGILQEKKIICFNPQVNQVNSVTIPSLMLSAHFKLTPQTLCSFTRLVQQESVQSLL